jgi:hypothetical protein
MSTPIAYKKGYPFEKNSLVVSIVLDRDPTSADIKNPQTGGYIQINTICTNRSTNASFIYTSAGNWAGITDAASGNVDGPASATENALARFDGTTGKIIKNSSTTLSAANVMTFPAQGGVVLTAGGANPRKGVATLVAGTVTVTTTAAVTGSVICLTIVTLGTVATAKSMLVTITNGVNFAITSEDNTDTSVLNWAIVA